MIYVCIPLPYWMNLTGNASCALGYLSAGTKEGELGIAKNLGMAIDEAGQHVRLRTMKEIEQDSTEKP